MAILLARIVNRANEDNYDKQLSFTGAAIELHSFVFDLLFIFLLNNPCRTLPGYAETNRSVLCRAAPRPAE